MRRVFHAGADGRASFYQPQRIAVSAAKAFDVLPARHGVSRRIQIDAAQVVEFGKRLVAKGKFAAGAEHLTQLIKQYHLQDNAYRETVQALFKAALATGEDRAIVENFEIIKEKLPDVEIDFKSISAWRWPIGRWANTNAVFLSIGRRSKRPSQRRRKLPASSTTAASFCVRSR